MMWIQLAFIRDDLDLFREAFDGGGLHGLFGLPSVWTWSLCLLGAVLATGTGLSWLGRDRAALGPANRRICVGLGVGFREQRLLRRVARSAGVTCMAGLLISEGHFDEAFRRFEGSPQSKAALRSIRRKVFGRG